MSDELNERSLDPGRRSYWRGVFEGGPFDGAAFEIEAMPGSGMRGMQLNVLLGEELETSVWHSYGLSGQRLKPDNSVETIFLHVGTLEDRPSWPPGVDAGTEHGA